MWRPDRDDDARAFLDLNKGQTYLGRITLDLAHEQLPRTCANFAALCTGEHGYGYRGTPFHRVVSRAVAATSSSSDTLHVLYALETHHVSAAPSQVPGFVAQGGDVVHFDGSGGRSIYGPHFADEDLHALKHNCPGMVAMASAGPGTNASQFYITLAPTPWLDGKDVVFGRVSAESLAILRKVEALGSPSGTTLAVVTVAACGVFSRDTEAPPPPMHLRDEDELW